MKIFNKERISFIICIIIAALIMFNYDPKSSSNLENSVIESVVPVMKSTSSSLNYFGQISENIRGFFSTYKENKALKERNDFLEYYFYLYKQLEAENKQLKESLNFSKNLTYKYITAQVIGRSNNSFNRQIIIDTGSKQSVKKGQIVTASNQLIGRVIQVSENIAKILLLTDQTSRIPVTAIASRTKFVITGLSTNYFACKYLSEQPDLQEGELVVTSGEGFSMLPGIIVGSIFKEDNNFYVKPNIDFDKIEFVQILQIEQNE